MATITVKLDTNVGPFLGRPIAPAGWALIGSPSNCAVNPLTGEYFRTADVVPDVAPVGVAPTTGTAPLIEPPNGWQITDTGIAVLSLAVAAASTAPSPVIPATIPQGSELAAPNPANPAFFTIAS